MSGPDGFATLQRLARRGPPVERCDVCGAALAETHSHLLEPVNRKLMCACEPCALLFAGRTDGKYKRVPTRVRYLPDFRMTDAQWESLGIPVNLAFFFESAPLGRTVALYPSPAGATESLLSFETWRDIACRNPALRRMQPDVEALLVDRLESARGQAPAEHFLLPIDKCFYLVGLVRKEWRGFSGGADVWEKLAEFLATLKAEAYA